jgi:AbrB family looped-hinge helix DNA binding protein
MTTIATTTLSTKGRVVIPEDVRAAIGLAPGAKFVVMGHGDAVILKKIHDPARSGFRAVAAGAREWAGRAGPMRADVKRAVRRVRRRG